MHQRAAKPGVSVRRFSPEDLPDVLELLDASLGGGPDPLGLPLGFGPRASGPPSLYAFSHLLKELGEAIPNLAMASGFVMPPSTTALTAPSEAFMGRQFITPDLPPPCVALGDGSGVFVTLGPPADGRRICAPGR